MEVSVEALNGPLVRYSVDEWSGGFIGESLHFLEVLKNEHHHGVHISFCPPRENKCPDARAPQRFKFVFLALNFFVLRYEKPTQVPKSRK